MAIDESVASDPHDPVDAPVRQNPALHDVPSGQLCSAPHSNWQSAIDGV
jgi:hypothetical protein